MSPNSSPELLVTGLDGLIGSALASGASPGRSLAALGGGRHVDVTDRAAVEGALDASPGARVLLHLAAFTHTDAAHAERGDRGGMCYRVNVGGTRHVARACAARGIHLIYVSTDFVFRGDRETPYSENDAPDPIDWYGQTKAWGEEVAREAPAWTIVRLAYPYGSPDRPGDLLAKMLRPMERGEPLRLFDDQHITPTYIEDIATGLLALARTPPHGEVLHLAGPDCVSPLEFGRTLAETFGFSDARIVPTKLADLPGANLRPRHRRLCLGNSNWVRVAGELGVAPPRGVREGLRTARQRRDFPQGGRQGTGPA